MWIGLLIGVLVGSVIGAYATYFLAVRWIHKEVKKEVEFIEQERLAKIQRQLHDAGRSTVPRRDTGRPAVVRPVTVYRRSRKP